MVRSEEYSSFQIYRPVLEDADLSRFLSYADSAGDRIFSNSNVTVVESVPDEFDDETFMTIAQPSRSSGLVPRHEIYNRNGLKLALLDLRSPRPLKSQAMMRAYNRFEEPHEPKLTTKRAVKQPPRPSLFPAAELKQAALKRDIPDSSELIVSFGSITLDFDPKTDGAGYELALVPDPEQIEARLLLDEAAICFNALASSSYRDLAYPTAKSSLFVSFARTPNITNREDEAELSAYVDALQSRLPLHLMLGEPKSNFTSS